MTKREYKTTVLKIAVHPDDESPLYGNLLTHVSIEDEGGGPYLVIEQFEDNRKPGVVRIDFDELPAIALTGQALIQGLKNEDRT